MAEEKIKIFIDKILADKKKQIIKKIEAFKQSIITQLDDLQEFSDFSKYEVPEGVTMDNGQRRGETIDILYNAIKNISSAGDQKNLIAAILKGIHQFASRAALFLIKDDKLIGWNGSGFSGREGEIKDDEIKKIFFSLSANTVLKNAIRGKKNYSGKPLSQPDDHLIYNRFGGHYPDKIFILPFFVKGKPQAVIYSDSLNGKPIHEKEIEIIALFAQMSLDLLPIKQKIFARVQTKEYGDEETFVSEKTEEERVHEETAHSIVEGDPDRKARVIINDIILYNRDVVEKGIQNKNLYNVLEDTILQAKEEYLRKFSNLSSFEKNLVSILAKGDKTALRGYKFETM